MIIGILAAVAIPMYIDYTIKAKLTEVTNAISYVVTALDIYHHDRVLNGGSNVWPDCGNIAEIQTSLGVGLVAIGRIGAASVDRNTGVISVTVANIHGEVDGSTITLTPSINASDSFPILEMGRNHPTTVSSKAVISCCEHDLKFHTMLISGKRSNPWRLSFGNLQII